jgi:hypothetical protein
MPSGNGDIGIGIAGIVSGGSFSQLQAQLTGMLALGVWGLLWGIVLGFIANPRLPGLSSIRSSQTVSDEDKDDSVAEELLEPPLAESAESEAVHTA